MTITGYTITGLGGGEKHYLCPTCAEELAVDPSQSRIGTVKPSQFRYGNGDGGCLFCGFDTLDALAERALDTDTDTPRDHVSTCDQPNSLAPYADVLDACSDAFVCIRLGPGVEAEETEIAPGVKAVSHPDDAPETLVIEFQREQEHGDSRKEACECVENLLSGTPLETAYYEDNRGDGYSDAVIAVTSSD